jgi:hypothetical protein
MLPSCAVYSLCRSLFYDSFMTVDIAPALNLGEGSGLLCPCSRTLLKLADAVKSGQEVAVVRCEDPVQGDGPTPVRLVWVAGPCTAGDCRPRIAMAGSGQCPVPVRTGEYGVGIIDPRAILIVGERSVPGSAEIKTSWGEYLRWKRRHHSKPGPRHRSTRLDQKGTCEVTGSRDSGKAWTPN